jgi:hypothetical protein
MANPKKIIKAVKSAKKAAERAKTNKIQKNSVKLKPAAKQIGNIFNEEKAIQSMLSSASRGGIGRKLGKARDSRLINTKKLKQKLNQEKFINEAKSKVKPTIKINSSIPKKRGK